MIKPSEDALILGPLFTPSLGFRPRGRSGDSLGPGVGASLEFEDRRSYSPGDDLRHVDWRAMARTGEVLVRVHREEVQPRLDVLLDGSRSMATEPEKAQCAVDLAGLLLASGSAAGFQVRCTLLGEKPTRLSLDELRQTGVAFDQRTNLGDGLRAAQGGLLQGSLRVCLSDFLSEDPPGLQGLGMNGGSVALLQILGPWEADPQPGTRHKLVDVRSQHERDLSIDAGLVAAYMQRLGCLVDELVDESRRLGMRFGQIVAGPEVAEIAREILIPCGVLEPT